MTPLAILPVARAGAAIALGLCMALGRPALALTDEQFHAANAHFLAAVAGDKDALAPALARFGELLAADPANPLLLAHVGATTAMQARTTLLPWKKIRYAEDGMALQDKALALLTPADDARRQDGAAVSLQVRFVSASTFLAVPFFFNRGERGAKLLADVVASPLLESAAPAFKGAVWMRAARQAGDDGRPDDARRLLARVIDAGAPQAGAARAQLQALP